MFARATGLATVLSAAALALAACGGGAAASEHTAWAPAPEAPQPPAPRPTGTPPPVPSAERRLERVDRITGELTPKSVVASGSGLVVAQNMIYTHTVSVYDSDGELLETIDDAVRPSAFGFERWDAKVHGGPVEAAFSPDDRWLWVSNYSMSGPGFAREGGDTCTPQDQIDPSFLYRIDTSTLEVDALALVGAVPKYVETTPDGRFVLVTNWCDWTLSVVDGQAEGGPKEVATVPIGRYPRGIAVAPDSTTAYVAVMGASHVAVVDLSAAVRGAGEEAVVDEIEVGRGPRHLNLSPDGGTLYATLNHLGTVAKVDVGAGEVVEAVATGEARRSASLSPDGTALFVVNYESDTVSRVRTSDMVVLESVDVDDKPVGVTYDAHRGRIWVASYVGSLTVFDDHGCRRLPVVDGGASREVRARG